MPIRQIAVERFNVVSAKPMDEVLAVIYAAVGHPNLGQMQRDVAATETYSEMESVIQRVLGPTDLMEFMRLDMGSYLAKGRTGATPRSVRLLVGNPLIMRRMAEHVPDVASYAPVTILIDERADGVHISYDRMASFLAPYQNRAASAVASDLDLKIETLLTSAAC
jgi:uncharacterized protein (DUF302 family)